MIKNISISNYALIDKTEIALEPGLTVITGETGAGKSILLGAIGLTLGQRADASAIMDKGRKCVVEIEYEVGGYGLREWFEENDLDYADCVIVRREVTAEGKSRGFINDTPVNNKVLKEFGGFMVDIHSQHQSLLLGKPGFQADILDAFCGNDSLLLEYGKLYASYRKGVSSLEALKKRLEEAEKEEEYLRFRFNQLEEARLQVGEKEELERELDVLTHAESIKSVLGGMSWQLREEEHSVMGVLKGIVHGLEGISGFLPEAGEYLGRLESVAIELNDLADEAERKGESVEYDAGRIEAINARLNVLYDLLYKYKVDSVEDLVKLRDSLGGQLRHIEGAGGEVEEMEQIENKGFLSGSALYESIGSARFSIFPSECYENCPFAVMESLLCRTPVIGADAGGVPELIERGKTGELFPCGDADRLADCIHRLWNAPGRLEKYTENCREVKFDTPEEYCLKLCRIYQGEGNEE